MRVEPARELDALAELLAAEALEALLAERQARVDELDVRALAERVRDDGLVLLGRHRAGRVDDGAARLDRVDGAQEELLLEVPEEHEVARGL